MDVDTMNVVDEECYICESKLKSPEEQETGLCSFCADAMALGHEAMRKQKDPKPIKGNWQ